jgi:hypothetical protein
MKKRDYKSRGEKYFIEFLPPDIWDNQSTEERKYYNQYRNNHRWIFEGKQKIKEYEKQIEKLKKKVKEKEKQIKVWNGKMLEGYSEIGYLSKDYEFNCSVNLRKIKPRRLIMIEKGREHEMRKHYNSSDIWGDTTKRGTKRNNPSHSNPKINLFQMGVKGHLKSVEDSKKLESQPLFEPKRNLTVKEKYYVRIEPKLNQRFEGRRWIRNLYVGEKKNVIELLDKSNNEIDWKRKQEKTIRNNLREIYKGYVRYQIFKNGIQNIKVGDKSNELSQHPLDKVMNWVVDIGDDITDWMDK